MKRNTLMTIRQAAAAGPLTEHALRQRHKQNRLPGLQVNTRFYVNYPQLLEQIERESRVDNSSTTNGTQ